MRLKIALPLACRAGDPFTATADNAARLPNGHPEYGMPREFSNLWGGRLIMASTEVADEHGGFLEGALASAESASKLILKVLGTKPPAVA